MFHKVYCGIEETSTYECLGWEGTRYYNPRGIIRVALRKKDLERLDP